MVVVLLLVVLVLVMGVHVHRVMHVRVVAMAWLDDPRRWLHGVNRVDHGIGHGLSVAGRHMVRHWSGLLQAVVTRSLQRTAHCARVQRCCHRRRRHVVLIGNAVMPLRWLLPWPATTIAEEVRHIEEILCQGLDRLSGEDGRALGPGR